MGIKTEDMVRGLPPKEVTEGVDWIGILDSFNPKELSARYLNECARRNPFETCYRWDTPYSPVDERLRHAEFCVKSYRCDLEDCVRRIDTEGLTPTTYKNARQELIRNIGIKGAVEYVSREYDRLGEEGRRKQAEDYAVWEREQRIRWQREEEEYTEAILSGDYYEPESVHEKVIRIRKGLKRSNGKPLVQRDFAKLIGYPINKYTEAEKINRWGREPESDVEAELLDKLVLIAHANPYWLFDPDCSAEYAEEDPYSEIVMAGDAPCVYASVDVILKWINEGKPRITDWMQSTNAIYYM